MTIQKNPFLKYVMKDQKEDVFHSSAYARAQNGDNLGAASTESYQVRVNLDRNRQVVKGYGDSEIMMGTKKNVPHPKTYTQPGGSGVSGNGLSGASARVATPVKNPGISVKR